MNSKPFLFAILVLLISACNHNIKNNNADINDEIFDSTQNTQDLSSDNSSNLSDSIKTNNNLTINSEDDIYGYWVGDFNMLNKTTDDDWDKYIAKDEGLTWNRSNKINISINKLENGKVQGHSVVAGNHRPFEGTYSLEKDIYKFKVKEPGDDKYDGTFEFQIAKGDTSLTGTWTAYKNIDIKHREYDLQKKIFNYDPHQKLLRARRYANWNKEIKTEFMNDDYIEEGEKPFLDFTLEFESATEEIYNFNASDRLLRKNDVENLKQGDLFIIRNTIYARHGYSFKNRPLRVFFDAQPWYIPVHNDIKKDLTEIEKENIKLLMKYEKNAKAYYDSFGRG